LRAFDFGSYLISSIFESVYLTVKSLKMTYCFEFIRSNNAKLVTEYIKCTFNGGELFVEYLGP
jgi:hypothetical protein